MERESVITFFNFLDRYNANLGGKPTINHKKNRFIIGGKTKVDDGEEQITNQAILTEPTPEPEPIRPRVELPTVTAKPNKGSTEAIIVSNVYPYVHVLA